MLASAISAADVARPIQRRFSLQLAPRDERGRDRPEALTDRERNGNQTIRAWKLQVHQVDRRQQQGNRSEWWCAATGAGRVVCGRVVY